MFDSCWLGWACSPSNSILVISSESHFRYWFNGYFFSLSSARDTRSRRVSGQRRFYGSHSELKAVKKKKKRKSSKFMETVAENREHEFIKSVTSRSNEFIVQTSTSVSPKYCPAVTNPVAGPAFLKSLGSSLTQIYDGTVSLICCQVSEEVSFIVKLQTYQSQSSDHSFASTLYVL